MRKSPLWCRDGATLNTSEVRAICPTIHHRNFKYQTQLGGKYTVYTAFSQASTVLIQYDSVPQTQSKQRFEVHSTCRRAMMCSKNPGFWIHHVEDRQMLGQVTRVSWEAKAQTKRGSKVLLPTRPNDPWIFGWNLEDGSFGNPAWNSAVKRIYFLKTIYSSLIHEWEVSMGRLRSLTINFWLSHGHPSGFGSRKLIFPHQKRGRKEPSDFESRQNFIIQKFPRQWSNGNDSDDDLRCFSRLGGLRFTE